MLHLFLNSAVDCICSFVPREVMLLEQLQQGSHFDHILPIRTEEILGECFGFEQTGDVWPSDISAALAEMSVENMNDIWANKNIPLPES